MPGRTVWNTRRYFCMDDVMNRGFVSNITNSYCHSLVLWILWRMCSGSHVLLHNSCLHFCTGLEGSDWHLHRIMISHFHVWFRIINALSHRICLLLWFLSLFFFRLLFFRFYVGRVCCTSFHPKPHPSEFSRKLIAYNNGKSQPFFIEFHTIKY